VPAVQTFHLPAGSAMVRFHSTAYPANSFNPNTGKDWTMPEHGARFNPFPDAISTNVPSLYAADNFAAAALESVFHAVPHAPSPEFPRMQLAVWFYSELEVQRELLLFELINPNLRQLSVPGRASSLTESELIHSEADQYPNTRTWARLFYTQISGLNGLAWRPRLGGQGKAYVLFGADRCQSSDLAIRSGPLPVDREPGLTKIRAVAKDASIEIVGS
jgi:hypothetical protein